MELSGSKNKTKKVTQLSGTISDKVQLKGHFVLSKYIFIFNFYFWLFKRTFKNFWGCMALDCFPLVALVNTYMCPSLPSTNVLVCWHTMKLSDTILMLFWVFANQAIHNLCGHILHWQSSKNMANFGASTLRLFWEKSYVTNNWTWSKFKQDCDICK